MKAKNKKDQLLQKKVAKWQSKWKSIIFQDDIRLIANFGKTHAWARNKKGTPLDIQRKINKYPLKIHIFGIISFEGPLKLLRVDGNINPQNFIVYNDQSKEDVDDKPLCLDKDKFHTSKVTTNWLDENEIDYLILPSKGEDINLIQNVWYRV